jgi:hypothetical protein
VERLERDGDLVTLDDILAAGRRSMRTVSPEELARLVEEAVADSLLLKDRRIFFDRQDRSLTVDWVYRVNSRHPLLQDDLAGDGS